MYLCAHHSGVQELLEWMEFSTQHYLVGSPVCFGEKPESLELFTKHHWFPALTQGSNPISLLLSHSAQWSTSDTSLPEGLWVAEGLSQHLWVLWARDGPKESPHKLPCKGVWSWTIDSLYSPEISPSFFWRVQTVYYDASNWWYSVIREGRVWMETKGL